MTTAYERSLKFTEDKLDEIGNRLEELPLGGAVVLVCGPTVAVDYEFKTSGNGDPKPWAIRNIKLVFSRKLLYASGLFSIAMTADRAQDEKIEILEGLFDRPVMERMMAICGNARMEPVVASYSRFLDFLGDPKNRKHLEDLDRSKGCAPRTDHG